MRTSGAHTTLLVLCSLLQLPGSSTATSVKTHNLTTTAGLDVTLKCQLLVQDTIVTQVNWNFCNEVHIASHVTGHTTQGAVVGEFTKRVSLAEDYAIKVSNVSSSDAGIYCCVFNTFPRGKFTGKIHLEVLAEAAASSAWKLHHYLWIILPCGILLLAAGGLAIFYRKRRSRGDHKIGKSKRSPANPTHAGTPRSVPAVPAAQDVDDDQSQDYFNVIPYGTLHRN